MNQSDVVDRWTEMLIGADESVDFLTRHQSGSEPFDFRELTLTIVDSRLKLRCLIGLPANKIVPIEFSGSGWLAKYLPDNPRNNVIIVDNATVLLARFDSLSNIENSHYLYSQFESHVSVFRDSFNSLWNQVNLDKPTYNYIFEDAASEKPSIVVSKSRDYWDTLISKLSSDPELMHDLSSRKFEELIAELLEREGLNVHLTGETRDGGKDVIAWKKTAVGDLLYLVECKKYSPSNKVGVQIVRSLYGVVESEEASKGLIVTTSSLTRGALKFCKEHKYRLSSTDYQSLCVWLNEHHAKP